MTIEDTPNVEQLQAQLKEAQSRAETLAGERDRFASENETLALANKDFMTKLEEANKSLASYAELQETHKTLQTDRDNIAAQLKTEQETKAQLETRMLDFRRQNLLTRFKLTDDVSEKVKTMTDDQLSILETTLPGIASTNDAVLTGKGLDLGNGGSRDVADLTPYEATQRMIEKAKAR